MGVIIVASFIVEGVATTVVVIAVVVVEAIIVTAQVTAIATAVVALFSTPSGCGC